MTLAAILHNSIVHGAVIGAIGAASADIAAFRAWKSYHDVLGYDWSIASFRWLQGAILGALSAAGIAGLS